MPGLSFKSISVSGAGTDTIDGGAGNDTLNLDRPDLILA
jgi:Ca2+-binding RTX toxin-like protein